MWPVGCSAFTCFSAQTRSDQGSNNGLPSTCPILTIMNDFVDVNLSNVLLIKNWCSAVGMFLLNCCELLWLSSTETHGKLGLFQQIAKQVVSVQWVVLKSCCRSVMKCSTSLPCTTTVVDRLSSVGDVDHMSVGPNTMAKLWAVIWFTSLCSVTLHSTHTVHAPQLHNYTVSHTVQRLISSTFTGVATQTFPNGRLAHALYSRRLQHLHSRAYKRSTYDLPNPVSAPDSYTT